nr:hypothetical protein CFP56_58763 [Quercus suber]
MSALESDMTDYEMKGRMVKSKILSDTQGGQRNGIVTFSVILLASITNLFRQAPNQTRVLPLPAIQHSRPDARGFVAGRDRHRLGRATTARRRPVPQRSGAVVLRHRCDAHARDDKLSALGSRQGVGTHSVRARRCVGAAGVVCDGGVGRGERCRVRLRACDAESQGQWQAGRQKDREVTHFR